MAQKITTLFIDDIDGGEADGTVRFALDGTEYEIDLNARHGEELRAALGRYVTHARKVGGTARRSTARGAAARPGRHRGRPRLGKGTGHRHQGPRPGARRYHGQVPRGRRAVSPSRRTPAAAGNAGQRLAASVGS